MACQRDKSSEGSGIVRKAAEGMLDEMQTANTIASRCGGGGVHTIAIVECVVAVVSMQYSFTDTYICPFMIKVIIMSIEYILYVFPSIVCIYCMHVCKYVFTSTLHIGLILVQS